MTNSKVLLPKKIEIQNELQYLDDCLVHFERLKKEKLFLEYLNLKKKIDLTKENIKKYILENKEESKKEYFLKGKNYLFRAKISKDEKCITPEKLEK